MVNPLGAYHGLQTEECLYAAIGTLPAPMRFEHKYVGVLVMCNSKVMERCDPVRVVTPTLVN